MSALIDDLLMLSQVTGGELQREEVDLGALVRGSVARLRRADPHRDVEVVIQDGLVIEGDARLLAAAFDNLVGNAWKFTSKREKARIEIGSSLDENTTVYFIRDNGAGFDMNFAHKLFSVFQRLHTKAEFEGTGIGLATVQRIVHRHGGRLWADGKEGYGATFYFTVNDTPPA
jgi:light-regulated signal transduction histidine kinase (bacteriophytochrome)